MTVILTVYICIRGFCIETYVPTPITFACNDRQYHERFIAENYRRWTYEGYVCIGGRTA
jgi:hypothetical protein